MKTKLQALGEAKKLKLLKNQTAVKFDMDEIGSKMRHIDGEIRIKDEEMVDSVVATQQAFGFNCVAPQAGPGAVALGWGLCWNDWGYRFWYHSPLARGKMKAQNTWLC